MNHTPHADDESRLIRAAQDRDPTAFAALVLRHQRRIRSYLAVRLRNHHDVEDLTQEVFVTAFRKIDHCHADGSLEPWLKRIAANLLANHRRKFRATPIGLADELLSNLDRKIELHVEGDRETAALEALHECLGKLEDSSRRLLDARYGQQTSLEDLAGNLGRKASAVSMQLHRLRTALGECITSKLSAFPSDPQQPETP